MVLQPPLFSLVFLFRPNEVKFTALLSGSGLIFINPGMIKKKRKHSPSSI